jgi:DNA-directed RNA polymerase specialized sigma24 family protein
LSRARATSHHSISELTPTEAGAALKFNVTVTAKLTQFPRSSMQMELLRKVVQLRDIERLTFRDIAERLSASGYKSQKGHPLSPEIVFSIYKKGTPAKN